MLTTLCHVMQSRRLEVRLRTPKLAGVEQKKDYVHMLNATLTATERTLCCLLENYQTPEGLRYHPFALSVMRLHGCLCGTALLQDCLVAACAKGQVSPLAG